MMSTLSYIVTELLYSFGFVLGWDLFLVRHFLEIFFDMSQFAVCVLTFNIVIFIAETYIFI